MTAGEVRTAAWLTGLVAAVYANSLDGSFHYDDFHSIVDNPHVRRLGEVAWAFTDPARFSADPDNAMYRPLVLATYAANYALGGYDVFGYHVANVLLHLGCALLVWRVALVAGGGSARLAAMGAVLFAVHPVASEPVNYISSRSESLGALFLLAALWAYLRGEAWRGPAVALFAASLLSKATGVALPLLLLAWEWRQGWPGGPGAVARRLWPYALVLGAYLAILEAGALLPADREVPVRDLGTQAATQLKAVPYYLHLLGMPVHQSVDPAFAEGRWTAGAVWLGGALLASLTAVIAAAPGWLRWWLLWPMLASLPASAVPLNVLVNEHRVYLATAGLCLPLGLAAAAGWRRAWPALALVVALGALTAQRNAAWESERTLWEDAVKVGPWQARARVHLGNALRAEGRLDEARHQFETALKIDPRHLAARTNLANTLYERGAATGGEAGRPLLEAAAAHYEAVLADQADHREALINLGNAWRALGDPRRAADLYQRATEAHPNYPDAYANLADLAAAAGQHREAATWLERVVALEPRSPGAHRRLGDARAQAGELEGAAAAYGRACALDPADRASRYNLAEVLRVRGDREAAAGRAEGAAVQWRASEDAYAQVLAEGGDYRQARQRLAYVRERLASLAGGRPGGGQ